MFRIKKHFLFSISLAVIIIFSGCNTDNSPTSPAEDLVGTWTLTKLTLTYQGSISELKPEQVNLQMSIVINNDQTYKSNRIENGYESIESGKWSVSGSKFTTINENGYVETKTYTINSGNLIIITTTWYNNTISPATMEYKKL